MQTVVLAARRTPANAGSNMEIKIAIIPITTSSSTSVNARARSFPQRLSRFNTFRVMRFPSSFIDRARRHKSGDISVRPGKCTLISSPVQLGVWNFPVLRPVFRLFWRRRRAGGGARVMTHDQPAAIRAERRAWFVNLAVQQHPRWLVFRPAVGSPIAGFPDSCVFFPL